MSDLPLFIYANSTAGLTLTLHDMLENKVDGLVYCLDRLMMRPGYENLLSVRQALPWSDQMDSILLDATMVEFSQQQIRCISDYDGSKICWSIMQLLSVCRSLGINTVLCNGALLEQLSAESPMMVFAEVTPGSFSNTKQNILRVDDPSTPKGISNVSIIINNSALDLAQQGIIFTPQGKVNLLQPEWEKQFQLLAEQCQCPSCQQGLTRAYFHHLHQNTPLLSQRLLAIHNLHALVAQAGLNH